jgi:tRNA modification GTPase
MTPHLEDCIAAIASAPSGSARGIVRASGGNLAEIIAKVFRAESDFIPATARRAIAVVGHVTLSESSIALLCRLYFWPTTKSYTGQPSAEFHTIGSPPLLSALVDTLRQAGARLAEPGEFTLRAFLAGRIDLTQAEAVLGAIEAQSDDELRAALDQLAGGLGAPLSHLRDVLLDLLAHLEAGLDFADEAIEFITREELLGQLTAAEQIVRDVANRLHSRDGDGALPRVVLVGPPNAGKSSLFNALTRDGRAMIANEPGTTRDYLTARLELRGIACELIDTAGVDAESSTPLEAAAQRQTNAARQQADVEIHCAATETISSTASNITRCIRVRTKCDLASHHAQEPGVIATSTLTGTGLDELRQEIATALSSLNADPASGVRATALRCRGSLDEAAQALARAKQIAAAQRGEELVAAELRVALHALGEVVGAIYTDDLLDRVFSRFCIGK